MASNDTLQTIAGVLGNVLEWYGKFTQDLLHGCSSSYNMIYYMLMLSIIYCIYSIASTIHI